MMALKIIAPVCSLGLVWIVILIALDIRRHRRIELMKLSAERAAGTEEGNTAGSGTMADHGTGVEASGAHTESTGAVEVLGNATNGPGVTVGELTDEAAGNLFRIGTGRKDP